MAWDWERLTGPGTITEGPAWDGEGLWFTSIDESLINRYSPETGTISVVYRDTGGANGLAIGPDGALYACAGEGRAIGRYGTDGTRTILVDRFEGRRLNRPNDLVFDSSGRIWFTDLCPRERQAGPAAAYNAVYRLAPPADDTLPWSIRRMTFDPIRPNGLLLAPDERTLYVAQSGNYEPGQVRQLRAYPILASGELGPHSVLYDFGEARGIDGMCADTTGAIVACCGWEQSGPGPRVAIFDASGTVLEEHPVPAGRPTNCAFGGPDLDTLYVTTVHGHLYRVANTGRRGLPLPSAGS